MAKHVPATGGMNGLLVIDKPGLDQDVLNPAGVDLPTSHDVVQRVRRWSRQRRIGHTGTLDPMASGVLVLCLGAATRLVEYYQGHDKEYTARITLGATTDTYDALGQMSPRQTVPHLNAANVEHVLERFRGDIQQRPPAYSALKQGGESLHRKARRGEKVIVDARPTTVHRLELLSVEPPNQLWLRVWCSAGFYVRSLAHDVGEVMGCGGYLSYLRREAAGPFTVATAHTLDAIQDAANSGEWDSVLLSPGTGLLLPRIVLDEAFALRLGQGQRVWLDPASIQVGDVTQVGSVAQAVNEAGQLLGIVRVLEKSPEASGGLLCKAEKWLADTATD